MLSGIWTVLTIGLTVVEMNRCVDCRWWAGKVEVDRKGRESGRGMCHRYPPQIFFAQITHTQFPEVGYLNWCGEWAPKTDTSVSADS